MGAQIDSIEDVCNNTRMKLLENVLAHAISSAELQVQNVGPRQILMTFTDHKTMHKFEIMPS